MDTDTITIHLPPIQVPREAAKRFKDFLALPRRDAEFYGRARNEDSSGVRLAIAAFDHALETAELQLEEATLAKG